MRRVARCLLLVALGALLGCANLTAPCTAWGAVPEPVTPTDSLATWECVERAP